MRYSVKAAAIATGVTESRLRTWERRYGIPQPKRSSNGRRQYEESDLDVIRRMSALVNAGVPASEAAAAARVEGAPLKEAEPVHEEHPAVQLLLEASLAFDEAAAVKQIRSVVKKLGWADALDDAFFPALVKVGEYWGDNQVVSANEHFTTEVVRREIAHAISSTREPVSETPSIVLACPEDERHEIGLLALSLLLRERGIRTYYLGADVPQFDLMLAVQQTRSNALCLAATLYSSRASLTRAAREVVSSRLPIKLFFGGPAFRDAAGVETAPGVRLPTRVGEAADLILHVLAPEREE